MSPFARIRSPLPIWGSFLPHCPVRTPQLAPLAASKQPRDSGSANQRPGFSERQDSARGGTLREAGLCGRRGSAGGRALREAGLCWRRGSVGGGALWEAGLGLLPGRHWFWEPLQWGSPGVLYQLSTSWQWQLLGVRWGVTQTAALLGLAHQPCQQPASCSLFCQQLFQLQSDKIAVVVSNC